MQHQSAWECSGVTDRSDPDVNELKNPDGRYDWPEGELLGGIAGVRISYWADDINAAYLIVHGADRDAVRECWRRTAALFPLDIWP